MHNYAQCKVWCHCLNNYPLQDACVNFSTQPNHSLCQGVSCVSTVNMESEDTEKVVPQYNSFYRISDIMYAINSVEVNFSMSLRIDMPSSEEFLTCSVSTLQIYVNCREVWFCIKLQSYMIFYYFIFCCSHFMNLWNLLILFREQIALEMKLICAQKRLSLDEY